MARKVLACLALLTMMACTGETPPEAARDVSAGAAAPALRLVHNARIYTMDRDRPLAGAMLFDEGGRIHEVGKAAELMERFPAAERIDLGGRTVLPGLIDAHAHLYGFALSLGMAQLRDTASKEEVLSRLRAQEKHLSPEDWLLGRGWDQNDWPVKAFPTRQDLDDAFPDRPVWLRRIDGHAGWANSAALAMADQDLSGDWQPPGGHIHRAANGEATGILVDGAMALVENAVPDMSPALLQSSLDEALRALTSLGLTGVHDMGVARSVVELYARRIGAGRFPVRVYALTDGAGETLDWLCANGAVEDPSGRLYVRAVKLYIDGAMGSRGAALMSDYADDPGNAGLLFAEPADLERDIEKAVACGFQVGVHAIGDRGNRVSLDALESVMERHPDNPGRHRVEHAQTLAPVDIPRFAALGVIASVQPTHATSDMYWVGERLGLQRLQGAYAWRSLIDSGARLALGSDFPVEQPDPLLGIYAAVTRQDTAGWPPGGWQPEQVMSREEAVRGFTLDAAHAAFMEDEVGSLEAGKRADFVVLDADLFEVEVSAIPGIRVLQTWLDGERVYAR